jgi:hypothetical protein
MWENLIDPESIRWELLMLLTKRYEGPQTLCRDSSAANGNVPDARCRSRFEK